MATTQTPQQIVQDRKVAGLLLESRGLEISIRQIAERADVPHSVIGRYFGSKDELIAEALFGEIERGVITLEEGLAIPAFVQQPVERDVEREERAGMGGADLGGDGLGFGDERR